MFANKQDLPGAMSADEIREVSHAVVMQVLVVCCSLLRGRVERKVGSPRTIIILYIPPSILFIIPISPRLPLLGQKYIAIFQFYIDVFAVANNSQSDHSMSSK